jgi:hypothetical protein
VRFSSFLQRLAVVVTAAGMLSCTSAPETDEAAQVRSTFEAFKGALFASRATEALSYLDQTTMGYLYASIMQPIPPNESDAEIKHLIRRAVEKITPGGIQPGFNPDIPLQVILNKGWVNTHDLDSIDLGPITVRGTQARGEILWDGSHTTYQLVFVKEGNDWKVDLMGAFPYAARALQMDRMMKNETEDQQVDQLVSQIQIH